MKNITLVILSILFLQCGKTIVDPAYKTETIIQNNLKSNIRLLLYSNGKIIEDTTIITAEVFKYSSPYTDGPQKLLGEYDSLNITINNKNKTDVNCIKLNYNKNYICKIDSISAFNDQLYTIASMGQKIINTYFVDKKDSLEAR